MRLRHLSRSGWMIAGLLVGAIAIPAVTVAATATIVHVQGNGHTASVSPAGQLRVIDMDPEYFTHLRNSITSGNCADLGTASTRRPYIVRRISVSAYNGPASGDYSSVNVAAGSNCGFGAKVIADAQFSSPGTHEVDLGDGVALPAGTHLWLSANGSSSTADVYGYTVNPAAVPASTASVRRIGPRTHR